MTWQTYRCMACRGVAHPATGCQYSETTIICGPCVRRFWRWVKGHTNRSFRIGLKGSGKYASFYEAASKFRKKKT